MSSYSFFIETFEMICVFIKTFEITIKYKVSGYARYKTDTTVDWGDMDFNIFKMAL